MRGIEEYQGITDIKQPPKIDFTDRDSIQRSLQEYMKTIARNGELDGLIHRFRKSNGQPLGKFNIEVALNRDHGAAFGDSRLRYPLDAKYALGLEYGSTIIALLGFSIGSDIAGYYPSSEFFRDLEFPHPLVLQMQEIDEVMPRYHEAKTILAQIHAHRVLLTVTSSWAKAVGFDQIGVIPGDRVKWLDYWDNPPSLTSMLGRYNGTARVCGFRRQDDLLRKVLV